MHLKQDWHDIIFQVNRFLRITDKIMNDKLYDTYGIVRKIEFKINMILCKLVKQKQLSISSFSDQIYGNRHDI